MSDESEYSEDLKSHLEAAREVWGKGVKIEVSAPKKTAPQIQESLFEQSNTKFSRTGDIYKRDIPIYAVDISGNLSHRVNLEEAPKYTKQGYEIKAATFGRLDFLVCELLTGFDKKRVQYSIKAFKFKPSQIIESKTSYILYWHLKGKVNPDDYDNVQEKIYQYFHVQDALFEKTSLRFVPGFADSTGFMVKTILNSKQNYDLDVLLEGLCGGYTG